MALKLDLLKKMSGFEKIETLTYHKIVRQNEVLAIIIAILNIVASWVFYLYTPEIRFGMLSLVVSNVILLGLIFFWTKDLTVHKQRNDVFINVMIHIYLLIMLVVSIVLSFRLLNNSSRFLLLCSLSVAELCMFHVRPVISLPIVAGFLGLVHLMLQATSLNIYPFFSFAIFMVVTEVVSIVRYFIGLTYISKEVEYSRVVEELRLSNAKLQEASNTDALTHVYNRQALRNSKQDWSGKTVCVMMLDLDDFKYYNDNYGHLIGDDLLISFSQLIQNTFNVKSNVYRYGGDEFLVVSELSYVVFENKAHALQRDINRKLSVKSSHLTTSMGFVCGYCRDDNDFEVLLKEADRMLYEVKKKGKGDVMGKVFTFEEPLPSPSHNLDRV